MSRCSFATLLTFALVRWPAKSGAYLAFGLAAKTSLRSHSAFASASPLLPIRSDSIPIAFERPSAHDRIVQAVHIENPGKKKRRKQPITVHSQEPIPQGIRISRKLILSK